jgi:hypothetical protein
LCYNMKYDKLQLIKKISNYYCKNQCVAGVQKDCMGPVCPIYEILELIDDPMNAIGDEWIDVFLDDEEETEED